MGGVLLRLQPRHLRSLLDDGIAQLCLGAKLPHHWQPSLGGRDQLLEIEFVSRLRYRLDRLWSPLSKSGIARQLAMRLRRLDAGLGPFGDQSPLAL